MDLDVEDKRVVYHCAGVGHYWFVDPERRSLTVLRHTPDGCLYALTTFHNHIVRACC
jgi:Uma2 family endonuclease